jgi:hypothetical protein
LRKKVRTLYYFSCFGIKSFLFHIGRFRCCQKCVFAIGLLVHMLHTYVMCGSLNSVTSIRAKTLFESELYRTHTYTLTNTHTHILARHTHTMTHTLWHTHTHTYTFIHTCTCTHIERNSLSLSFTNTRTHTHIHTYWLGTHTLWHTLTPTQDWKEIL